MEGEKEVVVEAQSLVKPLAVEESKNKIIWLVALVFVVGSVSGWGLYKLTNTGTTAKGGEVVAETITQLGDNGQVEVGKVYGSPEAEAFSDTAKGVVEVNEEGGVGTHLLIREGGESQTVHLTSSVLDLDMFAGKKIEVWGETNSSEKVGWLMDVGRIKVLE